MKKYKGLTYRKPLINIMIWFLFVMGVLGAVGWATVPFMLEYTTSHVQDQVTEIVNDCIISAMGEEEFKEIKYENGVKYIDADVRMENLMKSRLTMALQERLDEIDEVDIRFPIGSYVGLPFSIRIPVKIVSISSTEARINRKFETAGVNQTRVITDIEIDYSVKTAMLGMFCDIVVDTQIPLSDTVIVGDTPTTNVELIK